MYFVLFSLFAELLGERQFYFLHASTVVQLPNPFRRDSNCKIHSRSIALNKSMSIAFAFLHCTAKEAKRGMQSYHFFSSVAIVWAVYPQCIARLDERLRHVDDRLLGHDVPDAENLGGSCSIEQTWLTPRCGQQAGHFILPLKKAQIRARSF